jgi:hypothetical protein
LPFRGALTATGAAFLKEGRMKSVDCNCLNPKVRVDPDWRRTIASSFS